MNLWAIVPVKPLRRGKSRLSKVLTDDERATINLLMCENTLKTLSAVRSINKTLVVSRDTSVLALARSFGARTLQEERNIELNNALKKATMVAKAYSAQAVMVLPADLPMIKAQDVEQFIAKAGNPPEMVINPDRRWEGTNALLVSPVGSIEYCFGHDSFNLHLYQARKQGMHISVCSFPSLEFDLDLPEDLELYKRSLDNRAMEEKPLFNLFDNVGNALEEK